MNQPIILNFDNSVGEIANSLTFDFIAWQEKIRFGCSMTEYRIFSEVLNQQLPNTLGPVLVGSGDYHHISLILIERLRLYFSRLFQILCKFEFSLF